MVLLYYLGKISIVLTVFIERTSFLVFLSYNFGEKRFYSVVDVQIRYLSPLRLKIDWAKDSGVRLLWLASAPL